MKNWNILISLTGSEKLRKVSYRPESFVMFVGDVVINHSNPQKDRKRVSRMLEMKFTSYFQVSHFTIIIWGRYIYTRLVPNIAKHILQRGWCRWATEKFVRRISTVCLARFLGHGKTKLISIYPLVN